MNFLNFLLEIIKNYLGLIIVLLILYATYNAYDSLDKVSVKGGYYTLYNAMTSGIDFIFNQTPKLFIAIPHFKIPTFGFLLSKVPKVSKGSFNIRVSVDRPSCSIPFPDPVGTAKCVAEQALKAAKAAYDNTLGRVFCITEDSLILMSDNSYKKIKDIIIGDKVKTLNGNINTIFSINKELIDNDILIYGINDIEPFFTDSHPIVSGDKDNFVLSINPDITLEENPERKGHIKKLSIGDTIYINNKKIQVEKITEKILYKNNYVYDLSLLDLNDISYIANKVAIESQEPNYLKNSPIIGIIISIIAKKNYNNRNNKEEINNIINNFILNNSNKIQLNKDINNLEKINKIAEKYYNNSIKMIINNEYYNDLGNFIYELWIKYYNKLIKFNNILLNDLDKLEY